MSSKTRSGNTILGGLGLFGLVAIVAIAAYFIDSKAPSSRWSKEQRDAFIETCSKKCKSSPDVTPDRHALCDKGCSCAADEAEKIASSLELAQYYLAEKAGLASNEQKQKMQKIGQAGAACLGEAFGHKN
jgi:hypothetical protein